LCQVSGASGTAYFDQVSLVPAVPTTWNEASGQPDPGPAFIATVNVDAGSMLRRIPDTLFGSNLEWTWDGNGLWNTATNGLDSSIVQLARSAGLTLHRFPGGVFADYYFWRNGVGAQGSRPAANALPTGPFSLNRFGTDEALAFAEQTNSRLLITVNVLSSTPQDAADWVRYVNGTTHRVDYWEIGNENYVPGPASLSPEDYAHRFIQFARAMRAVDPSIVIGAIADENFSVTATAQYPDWTERVVRIAGNEIDFMSVHCGYAPALYKDRGWDSRTVYAAMLAAPQLIGRRLNDLAQRLDALTPSRTNPIQIAVTEWGPYFQADPSSRFVDHSKTLASALFAASALKTFMESPRTQVANLFKLVDASFMGWIGIRQGTYAAKAPLLAVTMLRNYFGPNLVSSATVSPTYDAPTVGWVDSAASVPYLDIVASRSDDSKTVYVLGINKHFDREIQAQIHVSNFSMTGRATVYTLNGTAADANTGTQLPNVGVTWATQATIMPNSRFLNGSPTEVGITGWALEGLTTDFVYTFPAHSVTSIALEGR
jgi:alpha-N-arabinofuranosidase